jgi:hypothetical protein
VRIDPEVLWRNSELPEVKEADLKITAEAGSVTVTGQRKFGMEENAANLAAFFLLNHARLRPEMTLTSTMTNATTSRTWMTPPIV